MAAGDNIYIIGRGNILFHPFTPGTRNLSADGARFLGNAQTFNLNVSRDQLEHFSSQSAVKLKDRVYTTQVNYSGNLVLENIDWDNLGMAFLSARSTLTQTSGSSITEDFDLIARDRVYQIGVTAANPAGVKGMTSVSVGSAANNAALSSPTARTANVDFIVNAARGTIEIPATSGIPAGHSIRVTYTRTANSRVQVVSAATVAEGRLIFNSDNAGDLNYRDVVIPWVQMQPDSDFALIGDEWSRLSFQLGINKHPNVAYPHVLFDGQAA